MRRRESKYFTSTSCHKTLFFLSLFFALCHLGFSQDKEITISGIVSSATDSIPLPGVNISEQGSSNGTFSDFDGHYEIHVAQSATLEFSYVGYHTENVNIGDKTQINIYLEESSSELDEIVITGYGAQRKKVSSASSEFVKSEDIVNVQSIDATKAIQGQAAGLNITSNSGQPGAGMKVNIRGVGTAGNANPLYVVDGVVIENGIDYLDPSNIERIDVLKDAAASSIYGARAANGVILITTKRGRAGKMQVNLNSYVGFQETARRLRLLNTSQYTMIMNEARINSEQKPLYGQSEIAEMPNENWQDRLFNDGALMQNHSVRISGGDERATYAAGLAYYGQEGLIGSQYDQSQLDRTSVDLSTEFEVIPNHFKIGQNLSYSHIVNKGVSDEGIYSNSIRGFFNAPPNYNAIDANGEFGRSNISSDVTNPLGSMYYNNFNENISDRIVGSVYAEAEFLTSFTFKTSFGIDQGNNSGRSFLPIYDLSDTDFNNVSQVTQSSNKSLNWIWENTLQFNTTLLDHHNIDLLLGTSSRKNKNEMMNATGRDLIFDDFNHAYLSNATSKEQSTVGGDRLDYMIYSYFGRVLYDFDEKYLFTATLRRDASSEFGPNNKYAYFPAFSLGWNLDRENFFPTNIGVNSFKIRGSWGQNGNDQFNQRFTYTTTISSTDKNYHFGTGENELPLRVGSSPDALANPDLKWETSEQWDIGVDTRILNNFSITFDLYNKLTRDWIVQASVPEIAGAGAPYINGGNIRNSGVEFSVGYDTNFGSSDWKFSVNGNISYNKNEVTKINNQNGLIQGDSNLLFQGIDEINRVEEGQPIGYFYGLKTDGVFQSEEEIRTYSKDGNLIQPNAEPGDVRFVDLNNDGKIDQKDKTKIGDPNPDYYYGLNVSISYKAFDLSFYGYGQSSFQNAYGIRTYERPFYNYDTNILKRWTGSGTSNTVPRVTYGTDTNGNHTRFSDLYLQNASFFRIRTINLGVDLTKLLGGLDFFQLFRVYVSGNNLFTFTKYRGLDPEVGFGNVNQSWARGLDVGFYPQPRTYSVGLNINF